MMIKGKVLSEENNKVKDVLLTLEGVSYSDEIECVVLETQRNSFILLKLDYDEYSRFVDVMSRYIALKEPIVKLDGIMIESLDFPSYYSIDVAVNEIQLIDSGDSAFNYEVSLIGEQS